MLTIISTKKYRATPCCSSCGSGEPCCDQKPFVARPSGLLLPDRRVVDPRSMLWGHPGELDGVRPSWDRPLLMPVRFDMSCLPCCTVSAPCDECPWARLQFVDQVGGCTCLPDAPFFHPWTTATCPGNTTFELECEDGQWVFHVGGFPDATLVSYDPCVEMIWQLPDMTPMCAGTAKARITP